jgi:hypothetical protein
MTPAASNLRMPVMTALPTRADWATMRGRRDHFNATRKPPEC